MIRHAAVMQLVWCWQRLWLYGAFAAAQLSLAKVFCKFKAPKKCYSKKLFYSYV